MAKGKLRYSTQRISGKDIRINQRSVRSTSGQKLIITNPLVILGSKLKFWFDSSNLANITFNGSNVESQTDETGQYFRRNTTPANQPPYNTEKSTIEYDGTSDHLQLLTIAGGEPTDILNDQTGFYLEISADNNPGTNTSLMHATEQGVGGDNGALVNIDTLDLLGTNLKDPQTSGDYGITISPRTNQTYYYFAVQSDGSTWRGWSNGIEGILNITNGVDDGRWFGDLTQFNRIDFASAQRAVPFYRDVSEKQVVYSSSTLTSGEISSLFAWAATKI